MLAALVRRSNRVPDGGNRYADKNREHHRPAPDLAHVPRGGGRVVWAFLLYPHRMVLSPRAGYRIRKKTGRAVNRPITQTKTAISILLSQCLATDRGFRRRGSLTYDTRASGPQFNRARLHGHTHTARRDRITRSLWLISGHPLGVTEFRVSVHFGRVDFGEGVAEVVG